MKPHKIHMIAVFLAILCALLLLHGGANHHSDPGSQEPSPPGIDEVTQPNQPIPLPAELQLKDTRERIPNFQQLSDGLYRGCQPDHEGFKCLHKLGIRTIVNLRSYHDDQDEIGGLDLLEIRKPLDAWEEPPESAVRDFLMVATNPSLQPVYVHCQHGVDRTGTMCAVYRMVVQDWDPEMAITEMRSMGGHKIWRKTLEKFLRKLDVEKFRKELSEKGRYPLHPASTQLK